MQKKSTNFLILLLFIIAVFIFALYPANTFGQTIPTRTPTPSAGDPTATPGSGGNPTNTPVPSNDPTNTPVPNDDPTNTPVPNDEPTATAVSGEPTATTTSQGPTATAVSGEPTATTTSEEATATAAAPTNTPASGETGSGDPAPTATTQSIGSEAPEESYPAPPSANPDSAAYPAEEGADDAYPVPEDSDASGGTNAEQALTSAAESNETVGETAVNPSESDAIIETGGAETAVASGAPNLLPIVGLVLLASGVFGIIFWRRRNSEEN